VFVAAFMARTMEKRVIALAGIGLIGLCQLAPVLLAIGGAFPMSAATPDASQRAGSALASVARARAARAAVRIGACGLQTSVAT
jgi:hypothetical protein